VSAPRRKLVAIDDPLAAGPAQRAERRAPTRTAALYVRLRLEESDRLARAAFELRAHKREIIGALIARHVDGSTEQGREALRVLIDEFRELCE
jgi:hypothetical protein